MNIFDGGIPSFISDLQVSLGSAANSGRWHFARKSNKSAVAEVEFAQQPGDPSREEAINYK